MVWLCYFNISSAKCSKRILASRYLEFKRLAIYSSNSYIYSMSREEVKTAINEILEKIPEEALQEVFDYLKSVQDKSTGSITLSKNLRTILNEDKDLLDRLAK